MSHGPHIESAPGCSDPSRAQEQGTRNDAPMRGRDLVDLLMLAALWGGSFLFMRIAGPQFGPAPLMGLRTAIGALTLLPLLWFAGQWGELRAKAPRIAVVGLINAALPFVLFGYATNHLNAGIVAVLNATAPLWAAVVAFFWLGERLDAARMLGLALGVVGVLVLIGNRLSFGPGAVVLPVLAALVATLFYGLAANYVRRFLHGAGPIVVAAGSLIFAASMLAPFAVLGWPTQPPDRLAWTGVVLLGLLSTGLAYVLFFRLIERVGPARAITVTFLVPVFGLLWGALFLDEVVTSSMLAGTVTILVGTALTTGVVDPFRRWQARRVD